MFFTENSPPLESLQAKGLLARVDSSTLASTPARFNSAQADWVGVSARVSVHVYNPALISASQLPTRISQLAGRQYSGKLALAPGETDFQPIVTASLRAYGQAATLSWLKAINANAAGHIYGDNETVVDKVNRGQAAFGIINQYYWFRLRAETGAGGMHSKLAFFAPGGSRLRAGRLRGRDHALEQAPGRRAEVPGIPGQQARPGDHRHSRRGPLSFEYPIASGVTTKAASRRSGSCGRIR